MSFSEVYATGELHPIDIVEHLAEHHEWEFDRVGEDQIAMALEGQWRTYALTLAWSPADETLRLVATFELDPPEERLADLYALLNRINDTTWTGAFSFWQEEKLMVWRYGLVLAGGQIALPEQIDRMIVSALGSAERFYPAMELVGWAGRTPEDAMQAAIAEAYGRA